MNKWDLNKEVAAKTGLPANKINEAIDAIAEVIVTTCRDKDDKVAVPNLGIFKSKINKARTDVPNPLKKGETMNIPESRSISFRPSSNVKKIAEANPAKKAAKAAAPAKKANK